MVFYRPQQTNRGRANQHLKWGGCKSQQTNRERETETETETQSTHLETLTTRSFEAVASRSPLAFQSELKMDPLHDTNGKGVTTLCLPWLRLTRHKHIIGVNAWKKKEDEEGGKTKYLPMVIIETRPTGQPSPQLPVMLLQIHLHVHRPLPFTIKLCVTVATVWQRADFQSMGVGSNGHDAAVMRMEACCANGLRGPTDKIGIVVRT